MFIFRSVTFIDNGCDLRALASAHCPQKALCLRAILVRIGCRTRAIVPQDAYGLMERKGATDYFR